MSAIIYLKTEIKCSFISKILKWFWVCFKSSWVCENLTLVPLTLQSWTPVKPSLNLQWERGISSQVPKRHPTLDRTEGSFF